MSGGTTIGALARKYPDIATRYNIEAKDSAANVVPVITSSASRGRSRDKPSMPRNKST